jgi:tetratricopeptide (TPR) repeat protein
VIPSIREIFSNHPECQKTDVEGQLNDTDSARQRASGMKPLGIITMCFPHVDDETRDILQSVMEAAENFGDFTERLCQKVSSDSTTMLAEYFACYFAAKISNFNVLDTFEQAGKIPALAEPLSLFLGIFKERRQMVSWDEMKQSILRALKAAPNDWIATHLYVKWRYFSELFYRECDLDVKPIETLTKRVNENRDLEYFKSYLLRIQGIKLAREANFQKSIEAHNQALVLARKHDDQIMVADQLLTLANFVKHTDLKRAIDLLLSSKELSERLNYRDTYGRVHHELGHIMGIRGELDAAIEYQLQYRQIQEARSSSTAGLDSIIAFYYNYSGDGEKALEFAETAIETMDSGLKLVSYAHAQKAWALINLGRIEEAKYEVEQSKRLAMKSGVVIYLIVSQIAEGILDKAENHYDSAVQAFEYVLRSLEQDPLPLWQNICLLNLVEIEIERLSKESIDTNTDSSGPWMERLDEHVEKTDLPGIAARSLILKAKLRQKQGRHDEVRGLLKEVMKAAGSPSMRYLKDIVMSSFPDVIVT